MQDIIGKPQSWRSGKTRQKSRKPALLCGNEALEAVIKDEAANDPERQNGSAPAANEVLREVQGSQDSLESPSPGQHGPERATSLRRSPRNAQTAAQHSTEHDCTLQCPVCSKTMTTSMIDINRHIGEPGATHAFSYELDLGAFQMRSIVCLHEGMLSNKLCVICRPLPDKGRCRPGKVPEYPAVCALCAGAGAAAGPTGNTARPQAHLLKQPCQQAPSSPSREHGACMPKPITWEHTSGPQGSVAGGMHAIEPF